MSGNEDQRYCMRPMQPEDLSTVSLWFEHLADLSLFERSSPVPVNKAVVEADWQAALTGAEPRRGYWFTIDDAAGQVMGIAGLESINHVHGDGLLAVYVAEQARRKGLAIRACAMLLDLAFKQLRLNRITTYYRQDNDATRNLITLAGFSTEGTIRRGWFAGGESLDVILAGILNDEWENTRKTLEKQLKASTELQFGRPPWDARVWPQQLT